MFIVVVKWFGIVLLVLALAILVAGQVGWLQGHAPVHLGIVDGRLQPPAKTPNSVSSQAALWPDAPMRGAAAIAPLPVSGSGPATIAKIERIVATMDGARVVSRAPDYLYAQFTTRWLKFVDDVEFWFDPKDNVIQVRSASRLGKRDFGVNRERVETIRRRLAAP